jgi:hypothetical protein
MEGGTAGNSGLGNSAVAVGQVSRNGQGSSLALAHARHALLVTLNYLKKCFAMSTLRTQLKQMFIKLGNQFLALLAKLCMKGYA